MLFCWMLRTIWYERFARFDSLFVVLYSNERFHLLPEGFNCLHVVPFRCSGSELLGLMVTFCGRSASQTTVGTLGIVEFEPVCGSAMEVWNACVVVQVDFLGFVAAP